MKYKSGAVPGYLCYYYHVGTNSHSLVIRELLGVSSLSEAIGQKPSRQALNPQPSDSESGTLIARPRIHINQN